MNQIEIPENVNTVMETLKSAGFEAYVVGGCVRDALLGRRAADWDITTNARPEQVKELFRRTVDTGIQHGTVTVLLGEEGFEVTTYRIDGEYQDSRHPKEVIFTPSLAEDLKRRDFTINAMAYNEEEGLVDLFGGVADLERKRICCVGDPRERFDEDALRILRAVRFSAQLAFSIEGETLLAISEFAERLRKVSAERIQVELVKLLTSNHPEVLRTAYETGITAVVLPEFAGEEQTVRELPKVPGEKVLRLAVLFKAVGEERAGAALRRLKLDNDTIKKVKQLVRAQSYGPIPLTRKGVRRAAYEIGVDYFSDHLVLCRAERLARQENTEDLDETEALYRQILEAGDCLTLKDLAVTGKDLMAAGVQAGPDLGRILNELLWQVIEEPSLNTKEELLQKL